MKKTYSFNRGNNRNYKNRETKAQRVAVNSRSNEGANQQVAATAPAKRNTRYVPFYRICANGMKLFNRLPDGRKTTSAKRESLKLAVMLSSAYPDEIRFWLDLEDQAKILLDSKRFERECVAWDRKPKNVAQNLVVEGKATVNRVLKLGLVEGYGERAKLFVDPLYEVDIKPEGPVADENKPAAQAKEVAHV